jgi:hypothetical protein
MTRTLRTLTVSLAISGSLPLAVQAQISTAPGTVEKYRLVREHSGAVEVLGESANTDEKWTVDLQVTTGEADAEGKVPLSIQATGLTASVPVIRGLAAQQMDFDSSTWNGRTAPVAHSMLQYLTLREKPLTLRYAADGALDGVEGFAEVAAGIDAGMVKFFSRELDFATSRSMYRQMYTENVQKALWNQVLVFDLPDDFEVGVPWTKQRLMFIQPYYVWVRGTYTAEDSPDGGYVITATYEVPAAKQAKFKADTQEYLYTVKNGTGTGTYEIDDDGRMRSMDMTLHVYLDTVLIAGGQRIPMDKSYHRLKLNVERQE